MQIIFLVLTHKLYRPKILLSLLAVIGNVKKCKENFNIISVC